MASDRPVDLSFPWINREGWRHTSGWWFIHLLTWEESPCKCTCTVILQTGEYHAWLGYHLGCSQQETSGRTPNQKSFNNEFWSQI